MNNPKLRRGVEALPVVYQGKRMILLRDRLGYSDKTLLINPKWAYILVLMDGGNTIRDIQADYMRKTGELIYSDDLARFFNQLDECLFLENDRFIQFMARQVEEFLKNPIRQAKLAGSSYPEDPEELKSFLRGFFRDDRGVLNGKEKLKKDGNRVVGIIVPHIDLNLGGSLYARGYSRSLDFKWPRTWIILGTSHEPLENFFALTCKDFETPLGIIETDKGLCSQIKDGVSFDILAEEYNHAHEHTIEFQTLFLKLLDPKVKIVPIICSFSEEDYEDEGRNIDEVIDVLRRAVFSDGAGIIASVDFAHIGPRYGDNFVPDRFVVQENLAADKRICKSLVSMDLQRFENLLWADHVKRRICGAAPLFVLGRVFQSERVNGELVGVEYGYVDDNSSFVTFCSAVFWKD